MVGKCLTLFPGLFFINKATMPINCVIGDHSKKLSQVSNESEIKLPHIRHLLKRLL